MILKTSDTRIGKDDAGVCMGSVTVVMDDDAFRAIGQALTVARAADGVRQHIDELQAVFTEEATR